MDTIYRGDLSSPRGRRNAWVDALLVDHAVFRLWWTNFSAVAPGALYRSNHPTPGNLAAMARKVGLRTLINLRGQARNGADALSREMAARLKLDFVDLALESRGAPQRDRILRLAETYRTMRRPALIHCKSGADRAGLAAGVFLILEGGSARDALRQLSLRHLHIRQSKTGILDRFFELYAAEGEGRMPFLDWVTTTYDEAGLRAAFKAGRAAEFVNARILRRE